MIKSIKEEKPTAAACVVSRFLLLFSAFSVFAPLWGVGGSAKQASVSPSVSYSVYMYRVKMSILNSQNVHSE